MDDNVLTSFSNQETNTINIASAIEENQELLPLKIYASAKMITIESEQSMLLGESLNIYNIQGQQLINIRLNNNSTQSYELKLNEGVYLIHCTYNGKAYTQKIILR